MRIERTAFGGPEVELFSLINRDGNTLKLTNYGAIIVAIDVPDREGVRKNVNLGFESLEGYKQRHPYFGATVGRFANRIAGGQFSLDGKSYPLAVNNGPNHLHGGIVGFDRKIWQAEELHLSEAIGIRFRMTSEDGDEGYPGTVQCVADYLWDNHSKLTIRYQATTDRATPINLTNHAYFNLGGCGSGKVYQHLLKLRCSKYLEVNDAMIPTGLQKDVVGTPMDFLAPHAIGERIETLTATQGYDHCFVVEGSMGTLRPCAEVSDPKSGRAMTIETTLPGVQLYTGNFLSGGADCAGHGRHEAFCLETQHFPDAPNQASFPSCILRPGETFDHTTTFRFHTM